MNRIPWFRRSRPHRDIALPVLRRALVGGLLVGSLLLAGCAATRPASPPDLPSGSEAEEVFYASMLSTRKHQLSGQNPVVGLFYSRDGGENWTHTGWKQGHLFAAMAVPGGGGDTLFTASGNGVHRTTDGGDSWRITTGWRVTEVQDVTINPADPSQVFAATPYGVFVTDDLGDTWEERSEGLSSRYVASVRVDRTAPARVFAGTEAGLFVSDDAGRHWRPTPVTEAVRSIRQSPSAPERWAVGVQDRGVALSRDGGRTWTYGVGVVADRTIYEAEFDPADPDRLLAGGWETGVMRTEDFGRTWTRSDEGLGHPSVHSLALSRRQPGLVLVGTMGGGLARSVDGGRTWAAVAPAIFDLGQIWDLFVEGEQ